MFKAWTGTRAYKDFNNQTFLSDYLGEYEQKWELPLI